MSKFSEFAYSPETESETKVISLLDEESKSHKSTMSNYMDGYKTLSVEQKYAFQKFMKGENLFITGAGGTGKTRLIQIMVEYLKSSLKKYQICAMTGCAAVLLNCSAKTLHSWSGIKLARGSIPEIVGNVLRNKKAKTAWQTTQVLIVDEVSMMSKKIFDVLDAIGRAVRRSNRPFGGLQVVFTGDFYQLPPVGSPMEPDTCAFAFESTEWYSAFPLTNHIEFHRIFRQTDLKYIEILMQIRRGEINEENKSILMEHIGKPEDKTPTKLFAIKSKVDHVNRLMFDKLTTKPYLYKPFINKKEVMYIDTAKLIEPLILEKCRRMSPNEVEAEIDILTKNSNITEELCLKVGTQVMCIFNLDVEHGICNGSQGIVTDFVKNKSGEELPVVKFFNGVVMTISKHVFQSEEYPTITVAQLPLCLAWALTIHKIQGATLDCAEMDLGNSVFEYGQSYVGLSRVRNLDGLFLSAFNANKIRANPVVTEFYSKIEQPDTTYIPEEIIHNEESPPIQNEDIKIIRL